MSKEIDFSKVKKKAAALLPRLLKHSSFIVIIFVLFVYLFTVWRISQLATAEPSPDAQSTAEVTSVPKVDQKAINQVLNLENNSPQVHSLFNDVRNNPFNE